MAATNAAKLAHEKAQHAATAQRVTQRGGTGTGTNRAPVTAQRGNRAFGFNAAEAGEYRFTTRGECMEVVGAITMAAGSAAQRRDHEHMLNLLGTANRMALCMTTTGRAWQQQQANLSAEPPPFDTAIQPGRIVTGNGGV